MGTWASIYIKTTDTNRVVKKLAELSEANYQTKGKYPKDFYDSRLKGDLTKPNYFLIKQTQSDWISIAHNGFRGLEDWGEGLSKAFNSKVIITTLQTNADYYAFIVFDSGQLIRHVEVCYGENFDMINKGTKLPFENDQPGKKIEYKNEVNYVFDIDSVDEYSKYFGLDRNADTEDKELMILKKKKPWWEF